MPARSLRQRVPDALNAGKAAFHATALLDRPGERRLDGIDALIELVAIEAEPRLEPERVAGAEPDRGDAKLSQKEARKHVGARPGKRDLVPVLAGVARAGDEGLDAGELGDPGAHERHAVQPFARREARKSWRGQGSLEREQRHFVQRRQAHAHRQPLADEGKVDGLARRVDDEPQNAVGFRRPRHHQVVDDAAAFVQELGVALPARPEVEDVRGNERLEESGDACVVRPFKQRLAHVRHVKQTGCLAGVQMLSEDARRVLDRHVVAGERSHPGAELDVESMEGRLLDRVAHGAIADENGGARKDAPPTRPTLRTRPLCPMT